MCANNEDSDMKIVGSAHTAKEDGFDALQLIEEAKTQRFNGNSAKAKMLGSNIVSSFSYKAAPEELLQLAGEYGIEVTDNILLQMKILSVFSAEYCIDNFLPSPMLSTVAIGELYDVLERVSPEFYEQLSNSLAFSFYYLCIRESGDTNTLVGKQFAMLCGKKSNKAFSKLGTRLHEINVNVYKKAIQGFAFV